MTQLLFNDFEAIADNGTLPGTTTGTGAGMKVIPASALSTTAVSGAKIYGQNSAGDSVIFSGIGIIGGQEITTHFRLTTLTNPPHIGHNLRSNSNLTQCYRSIINGNGTALGILLSFYNAGNTTVVSPVYNIAATVGDVIHHCTKMVGNVLECRVWVNSDPKPVAPNATWTDTSNTFPTGYVALQQQSANVWAWVDDIEITDGASSGATITCTVGNATAAGATASIQKSTTIAGSVGNAAAAGSAATITSGTPSTTVACTVGNAAAAGLTAAFGTFIQSDQLINNTGTLLPSTAVYWTWTPAGRIGSMVGITPVDGTGTTDANARLAPGIARAAGKLDISVRAAAAVDDAVYTEMFA